MANGISTLGQALDQISRLKTQQRSMDLLSTQLNTGKKTQQFSGLGGDAILSQRARANISALDTYTTNIKVTERRIQLMNSSMTQVTKQAESVLSAMQLALQNGDYPELSALQDMASDAYDYIVDMINSQDGDRYLFAGADASVKPVTKNGLMETFMGEFVPDETDLTNPPLVSSAAVGSWGDGTITTEQFIESYHSANETLLGYSGSLSSGSAGKVSSRVSGSTEIDYTVLANNEGIKQILTALSVLKSLPPVEFAPGALNDPTATTLPEDIAPFPPAAKQENFYKVIEDLRTTLNSGLDNLETESFKLAQVQARLNNIKTSHAQEVNTLKSVVADVENVDTTEVAAKITQLQVQIEASYQVTALTSQLTLVNFL